VLGLISLIIATVSIALLSYGLLKGDAYNSYVEALDPETYPLKGLYTAGFKLNSTKYFRSRGTLARTLKKQAAILYGDVYFEYYADLAWAQFLTLSLLTLSAFSLLASITGSSGAVIFLLAAVIAVAVVRNTSLLRMRDIIEKRRDDCISEFPNMISKLSLLVSSGMILHDAWKLTAKGRDSELYELMKKACELMENGESDLTAIYKFGVLSDVSDIKKFSSAIIQGMEKGNASLADFLAVQARELWQFKRQCALQKGEIAAGKLIIPLGVMFGGIIMIIVAAAMQSMTF
jgi:tight adherence protein C